MNTPVTRPCVSAESLRAKLTTRARKSSSYQQSYVHGHVRVGAYT